MVVSDDARILAEQVPSVIALASVPHILKVIARTTGAGFVGITRPSEGGWVVSTAYDPAGIGAGPEDVLEVQNTLLPASSAGRSVTVVDDLAELPGGRDHPALARHGMRSYVSVPITQNDGRFYGTICALDRSPRPLDEPVTIGVLEGFAELIGRQLADPAAEPQHIRNHLRAERVSLRRREEFIAILGHDLRSPMATIASGLRLLEREGQSEAGMRTLTLMQATLGRMNALVDNLLDLARGRVARQPSFQIEPCSEINAEIEQVIQEIRAATGHEIEYEWNQICMLRCDRRRMGQLVSNLVMNAVKHGDPAAPVRVECRLVDERFTIMVENRGRPIQPEIQETMFDPFVRGRDDERRSRGFGLGLHIARETARAHSGTLTVDSTEERTRFTFSMPA